MFARSAERTGCAPRARRRARRSRTLRHRSPVTLIAVVVALTNCAAPQSKTETRASEDRPVDTRHATLSPTTTRPSTSTTSVPPSTTTTAPPGYAFPVSPASVASYARSHHDYPAADIFAPCGTEVVAPHAGVIQDVSFEDTWAYGQNTPESRGGLSFSIVGDDGVRYYGSHLAELDPVVAPGARVATGQRIGTVGETGNAKGTGCHLHFGISTPCGPADVQRRRGEFWPQEHLDAWARGEQHSPAALVLDATC